MGLFYVLRDGLYVVEQCIRRWDAFDKCKALNARGDGHEYSVCEVYS